MPRQRVLGLQLHLLSLKARQLRSFRGQHNDPQEQGDDEGAAADEERTLILADGRHLRPAFFSRLAAGVIETVKGKEIVPSGFAVVAPCTGLVRSLDLATALIQASEMARLGPGPVTFITTLPIAADDDGVVVAGVVAVPVVAPLVAVP